MKLDEFFRCVGGDYGEAKARFQNDERIVRFLNMFPGDDSMQNLRNAMNAGDKTAKALVSRYIRYVGEGLVNIGNYIRPEIIFMGGGISNQGDWFIKRLQAYVTRYSYGGKRNPYIKVVKATLKNEAGILGAAALVAKSS